MVGLTAEVAPENEETPISSCRPGPALRGGHGVANTTVSPRETFVPVCRLA